VTPKNMPWKANEWKNPTGWIARKEPRF
jgi:hypothetical protein